MLAFQVRTHEVLILPSEKGSVHANAIEIVDANFGRIAIRR